MWLTGRTYTTKRQRRRDVKSRGLLQSKLNVMEYPIKTQDAPGVQADTEEASPGRPQVHEKVTVVHPRHPDEFFMLGHSIAIWRRKWLQIWQFGLKDNEEKAIKAGVIQN